MNWAVGRFGCSTRRPTGAWSSYRPHPRINSQLPGGCGAVESNLAAHNRVDHVRGENFVFRNRHDVLRKYRDIAQFAGLQRALQFLFEGGVSVVDGVGLQGLHPGHALVGIKHRPVLEFAADTGVEARQRTHIFHGCIGAVADNSAALHQFLPDVGAFLGTLRTQAEQYVGGVARAVNALHRGDHSELSDARAVSGAQVLSVLDPPAQVLFVGVRPERIFKYVEGFAVSAVADGVDAELEPVLYGEFGGFSDVRGVLGILPPAFGGIR